MGRGAARRDRVVETVGGQLRSAAALCSTATAPVRCARSAGRGKDGRRDLLGGERDVGAGTGLAVHPAGLLDALVAHTSERRRSAGPCWASTRLSRAARTPRAPLSLCALARRSFQVAGRFYPSLRACEGRLALLCSSDSGPSTRPPAFDLSSRTSCIDVSLSAALSSYALKRLAEDSQSGVTSRALQVGIL